MTTSGTSSNNLEEININFSAWRDFVFAATAFDVTMVRAFKVGFVKLSQAVFDGLLLLNTRSETLSFHTERFGANVIYFFDNHNPCN